jgi:hypothetical protein
MKFTSYVSAIVKNGQVIDSLAQKYYGHKFPSVKREMADTIELGAKKLASKFLSGHGGVVKLKLVKVLSDRTIHNFIAVAKSGAETHFGIWKA